MISFTQKNAKDRHFSLLFGSQKAAWGINMHNKPKKEMTNKERRDAGLAYISDGSIFEEQLVCRKIL